jgi:flavin reductase (DIM6/NTAB) family NADH-FMN oxidoreductase RutF
MNEEAKKKALRMISYGLYILTARKANNMSGATVSWVSQASFRPPMITLGIRKGGHSHALLSEGAAFALHMLSHDQKDIAERFFKPVQCDERTIGGLEFELGATGAPILKALPAFVECKVVDSLSHGDHTIFLAEILEAGTRGDAPALSLRDTPWHYGG